MIKEIRGHAANGPLDVRVLVPNPAPAEWHPTHPERRAKAMAAEQRPARDAARAARGRRGHVDGFVSTRHDPMDAIEEQLHEEPVDALVLAMPARTTSRAGCTSTCPIEPPPRPARHGRHRHRADRRHATRTRTATSARRVGRRMLNKVPEITLFFWVIKIMCTTVGETAADYLNDNLGFGLTKTTIVTGALLVVLLVVQFRAPDTCPASTGRSSS